MYLNSGPAITFCVCENHLAPTTTSTPLTLVSPVFNETDDGRAQTVVFVRLAATYCTHFVCLPTPPVVAFPPRPSKHIFLLRTTPWSNTSTATTTMSRTRFGIADNNQPSECQALEPDDQAGNSGPTGPGDGADAGVQPAAASGGGEPGRLSDGPEVRNGPPTSGDRGGKAGGGEQLREPLITGT